MPTLLDQLLGNADQSAPNTAQQILSARFQPNMSGQPQGFNVPQMPMPNFQPSNSDVAQSIFRNTTGFNGSPTYSPVSPQQIAGQNQMAMIEPYNAMLQGQGEALKNNITAQTGLPLAQAELQSRTIANQYAPQMSQADIAYKQAMAGQANDAVSRYIAERNFEYQNNPEMMQARSMAGLLNGANGQMPTNAQPSSSFPSGGMSLVGGGTNIPQQMQQNANHPQNGPLVNRGAILGKMGLIPAGQLEEDKNFSQSWQTYNNEGGDKRLQNSLDTIDQVISSLKKGQIETGGMGSRALTSPEGTPMMGMQIVNPDAMVARNLISSAILPQAKALFGSRVTNFDAQSLISSQGLDPMADTNTNIQKLQKLRNATLQAQKELNASGKYFQQNGTLSGYQGLQGQSNSIKVQGPNGETGTIDPSELQPALQNGWKLTQ